MLLLILLGAVLGPHGTGAVSDRVLAALDPLAAAALAVLGALIADDAPLRDRASRRSARRSLHVLLVLGSVVLLAAYRERALLPTLVLLTAVSVFTAMVAAAAWLLLRRSPSDVEQRVVILAAVVLLAGTADALSLSSLFCGYAAGLFWRATRGPALELLIRDLSYIRQPAVAFVLVVSGARAEVSPAFGLAAAGCALVVLVGIWRWKQDAAAAGDMRISTGVVAVAVALTLVRVLA